MAYNEGTMGGNPKTSKWRSTAQADRKRKPIQVTLSDEARARLELLAPRGMVSAFVEGLIMAAPLPSKDEGER